jgi:hypothetical protein
VIWWPVAGPGPGRPPRARVPAATARSPSPRR